MKTNEGKPGRWLKLLYRRSATVALSGLGVVVLTPFVFFPEIMGDHGVRHASVLRSAAALVVLFLGVLWLSVGATLTAIRFVRRARDKR